MSEHFMEDSVRSLSSPPPQAPTGVPAFLRVLSTQNADGSFPPSDALTGLAPGDGTLPARLVNLLEGGRAGDGALVVSTLLAVHLLETRFPDEEPAWRRAVRKARAWLKKTGVTGPAGEDLWSWFSREVARA